MEAIATYLESAGGRKVQYALYGDKIHCKGTNPMGTEFETNVTLADLRPDYSTTRQYGMYFFYCMVLGVILFTVSATDTEYVLGPFMQIFSLGIMGIGFLFFGRKISFVHFSNHHGHILLSIAKKAINQQKFEEFVNTLQAQIRSQQTGRSQPQVT